MSQSRLNTAVICTLPLLAITLCPESTAVCFWLDEYLGEYIMAVVNTLHLLLLNYDNIHYPDDSCVRVETVLRQLDETLVDWLLSAVDHIQRSDANWYNFGDYGCQINSKEREITLQQLESCILLVKDMLLNTDKKGNHEYIQPPVVDDTTAILPSTNDRMTTCESCTTEDQFSKIILRSQNAKGRTNSKTLSSEKIQDVKLAGTTQNLYMALRETNQGRTLDSAIFNIISCEKKQDKPVSGTMKYTIISVTVLDEAEIGSTRDAKLSTTKNILSVSVENKDGECKVNRSERKKPVQLLKLRTATMKVIALNTDKKEQCKSFVQSPAVVSKIASLSPPVSSVTGDVDCKASRVIENLALHSKKMKKTNKDRMQVFRTMPETTLIGISHANSHKILPDAITNEKTLGATISYETIQNIITLNETTQNTTVDGTTEDTIDPSSGAMYNASRNNATHHESRAINEIFQNTTVNETTRTNLFDKSILNITVNRTAS